MSEVRHLPAAGWLLRGGHVVDPLERIDGPRDLWIAGGKLRALARPGLAVGRDVEVHELHGRILCPPLWDLHVHLREPGFEEDETIATGAAAALAGGVGLVCCMANTKPVNDAPEVTRYILDRAQGLQVRVRPIAAVTRGLEGAELVDFEALLEAGAVAFSDDGRPVTQDDVMEAALRRSAQVGFLVVSHAEDRRLTEGGVLHEGAVSRALGVKGIPAEGETRMVERDVELALRTGGRLHIAHVSTKGSVEAVRRGRARGARVSAEAAPHHFLLTAGAAQGGDPNFKMNPPLRDETDRRAVLEGIADGTIEVVATDHAPHAAEKKARGIEAAPFGVVGLETLLPAVLTGLVGEAKMPLDAALDRVLAGPARVLGASRAGLHEGGPAELVVFDPDASWTVRPEDLHSRSRNSAFLGRTLRGRVEMVVLGDRVFRP